MNRLSSIDTSPLRNIIRVRRFTILLSAGIAVILFALLFRIVAQDEVEPVGNEADSSDMLAYVSDDGRLMLYNPRDRTETTLLDSVQNFVLGHNGRIAFTKQDENDTDLYIFDPSTPAITPINISENLAENNTPLGWSPDERYLAFDSYDDSDDHILYVWDGETTTEVMPDNGLDRAERFYVNWSYDGRLAFSIEHGWTSLDLPPEIYLWNGSTTTNLSQNPEGWDGSIQ